LPGSVNSNIAGEREARGKVKIIVTILPLPASARKLHRMQESPTSKVRWWGFFLVNYLIVKGWQFVQEEHAVV
jgi:hypothetical protein